MLTKTMTLLDRVSEELPLYGQFDEETSVRAHQLELDRQVWEDMGRPEVITVTIEPGDKLNVPEEIRDELPALWH